MKKETFEARHGENISRLKAILIVVCLIAIPVTFWVNHRDVGSVNKRVTKVESPCLRYGAKSKQCKEAFEQAVLTITHAQACAILRKAGLEITNCKGARLDQEQARDKHVATAQDAAKEHRGVTPTTGNSPPSQPGPPSGGHGGHVPDGTSEPHPQSPGVSNPPGGGADTDPAATPPPAEPAAPKQPVRETVESVADPVKEAVCTINALGIRICIP